MKYRILFVKITPSVADRASSLSNAEHNFESKNNTKAIKEYERFKKRSSDWLNIRGQNRYQKQEFKGLFRVAKNGKLTRIA